MPRAYSTDLRERVLSACERDEGSQGQVARRFRVSERTVSGWLRLARQGRRGPKPLGRGRSPVGGQQEALTELVAERNDATLAEYADRLAARTGLRRSASALCRALQRLGLVRKKDPARSGAGPARPGRGPHSLAGRAGQGRPAALGVPR